MMGGQQAGADAAGQGGDGGVANGFLFLRHLGLSRTQRSNLIRASGGLEFTKLDRVLRLSEAEHFTGEQGLVQGPQKAFLW